MNKVKEWFRSDVDINDKGVDKVAESDIVVLYVPSPSHLPSFSSITSITGPSGSCKTSVGTILSLHRGQIANPNSS